MLFCFFAVLLAYYTKVRKNKLDKVSGEEDKIVIDMLSKNVENWNQMDGFVEEMDILVEGLKRASDLPKSIGREAKDLGGKSFWYGFMIMVSLAMMNIEDCGDETGVDCEVWPFICAFVSDADHAKYFQALSWILFSSLRQPVRVLWVYCVPCARGFLTLLFRFAVVTYLLKRICGEGCY